MVRRHEGGSEVREETPLQAHIAVTHDCHSRGCAKSHLSAHAAKHAELAVDLATHSSLEAAAEFVLLY